jgi:hypothetical protein
MKYNKTPNEITLLKKLEDPEFIKKLLGHGITKKARNSLAEILSENLKSNAQIESLMKAMASYLHGTEFSGMTVVFRVLNSMLDKVDKQENLKIICAALYTEIEFHCSYITSFYVIINQLGKLLKKYPAFSKEFCTAERSNKILSQLDIFKSGISLYNQKNYDLLKIKRGTGEQTKIFMEQVKSFDSSLKSPYAIKLASPTKFQAEADSEDDIKCNKGSEYDIYDQNAWVKAKLEADIENYMLFNYKVSDKEIKAWVCKDSDDYSLADKKTKSSLFKALYKLIK